MNRDAFRRGRICQPAPTQCESWRCNCPSLRAGTGTALDGEADAVVVLPRGTHSLRASLTIGSQAISGNATSVTVAAARRWSTSARSDGAYTGKSVKLKVARGGREVRDFRAFVPMTCPGVTAGQFTTQIGTAAVKRLKVAPDGSFVAASTPQAGTTIRVRGIPTASAHAARAARNAHTVRPTSS